MSNKLFCPQMPQDSKPDLSSPSVLRRDGGLNTTPGKHPNSWAALLAHSCRGTIHRGDRRLTIRAEIVVREHKGFPLKGPEQEGDQVTFKEDAA